MKNFNSISYRVRGEDELCNKMHIHNDSYEVLQIVEGKGNFVIGGKPYPITPGAVYFTNAIYLHCSRPDEADSYVRSKVTVNATYFDEVVGLMGIKEIVQTFFNTQGGLYIPLCPQTTQLIDKKFKSMEQMLTSNNSQENVAVTMSLLEIILLCHAERPISSIKDTVEDSLIARTLNYINMNITEDMTIDLIARKNYVSKYYLCRYFKNALGVSIMKYILNQRLSLAKKQLVQSKLCNSEIAMITGFSGFSYFCRAFKQDVGITPTQYRKIYGKGGN